MSKENWNIHWKQSAPSTQWSLNVCSIKYAKQGGSPTWLQKVATKNNTWWNRATPYGIRFFNSIWQAQHHLVQQQQANTDKIYIYIKVLDKAGNAQGTGNRSAQSYHAQHNKACTLSPTSTAALFDMADFCTFVQNSHISATPPQAPALNPYNVIAPAWISLGTEICAIKRIVQTSISSSVCALQAQS